MKRRHSWLLFGLIRVSIPQGFCYWCDEEQAREHSRVQRQIRQPVTNDSVTGVMKNEIVNTLGATVKSGDLSPKIPLLCDEERDCEHS